MQDQIQSITAEIIPRPTYPPIVHINGTDYALVPVQTLHTSQTRYSNGFWESLTGLSWVLIGCAAVVGITVVWRATSPPLPPQPIIIQPPPPATDDRHCIGACW